MIWRSPLNFFRDHASNPFVCTRKFIVKNQIIMKTKIILLGLFPLSFGWACTKEVTPDDGDNNGSLVKTYRIVDTNQSTFYNNSDPIPAPAEGSAFYGQDAQYQGNAPSYTLNGDGTVTDNVTGLIWQASADRNGDGIINADDKLTYEKARDSAAACRTGGYSDWRLPTIKELYSLILFSGKDVGPGAGAVNVPFIDTDYFKFGYGDLDAGERTIDAQYVTSTLYVDKPAVMGSMDFGVNFADGRIKGYGLKMGFTSKTFYVKYVRGNADYGKNNFKANGDGTVTDEATGLMWQQADNGTGVNWEEALSAAENSGFAGYADWRLPNAKELQSIVDYSRSPSTTNSAAIDPLFACTAITNEAGAADYPFYWSGTTHAANGTGPEGAAAVYVSFGRAMGKIVIWTDVHGAGAQRSDPKTGDAADYPDGRGPQGDAIRMLNYVRLVRDVK
jgi:hypothetical protein